MVVAAKAALLHVPCRIIKELAAAGLVYELCEFGRRVVVRPRVLLGKHVPGIGLNQVYEHNTVPQLPSIKEAMRAVATEEA